MPITYIDGTPVDDPLVSGTEGDDYITPLAGSDYVLARGGNDTVYGADGDDRIYGGDGTDLLHGDNGNDQLYVDQDVNYGFQWAYGEAGNDALFFQSGTRGLASGGDGTDTFFGDYRSYGATLQFSLYSDGTGALWENPDVMPGARVMLEGIEKLFLQLGDYDDIVQGGNNGDIIDLGGGANDARGGNGNDWFIITPTAANIIGAGAGHDTLSVYTSRTGLNADYRFTVSGTNATDSYGSTYSGFDMFSFTGNAGNEFFRAGASNDNLAGMAGRDTLQGQDGSDFLSGGADRDTLNGGRGEDRLTGGTGADLLTGGLGADLFLFYETDAADRIRDFEDGIDRVQVLATALTGAPAAGTVPLVSLDRCVGFDGQFIQRYDATLDRTTLQWDANGRAAGGVVTLAVLDGAHASLAGSIDLI